MWREYSKRYLYLQNKGERMKRFIAIDEFNEPIRRFNTMREAKLYIRNKRGFTVQEISLMSILGEALL